VIGIVRHVLTTLRNEGFTETAIRAMRHLFESIRPRKKTFSDIRVELGSKVERALGGRVVKYGLFAGMRLHKTVSWGNADLGSMLLGVYEKEVQEILLSLSVGKRNLVDIGAADGYFAVGALVAGIYEESFCFEIDSQSRNILRKNSVLNGVQDSVSVFNKADDGFLLNLEEANGFDYGKSVFLIDIEGFELEILTPANLEKMRLSTIILETHGKFVGKAQQEKFESSLSSYHSITEIRTGARDARQFVELEDWTDDERWAIFSEGRVDLGRWLILSPK